MRSASLVTLCLVVLSGAAPVHAAREAGVTPKIASRPTMPKPAAMGAVTGLIAQLGDDQYAVRRRAEEELIRLGPEVFDALKSAENSNDLEIAERARYILQRMRVDWIRPEDPPEIRRLLSRYGDLPEAERDKRIARLKSLSDGQGLPALCRIARLEPAPLVARRAALAVLSRKEKPVTNSPILEACRQELGANERPPVVWIQLWLRELSDRAATLDDWNVAVEAEAGLLGAKSPETNFDVLYALLKRRLQMCHELGLVDETTAALMRVATLVGEEIPYDVLQESYAFRQMIGDSRESRPDQHIVSLAWALRWVIENKRWDVLDRLHEQRREQLHGSRRLLYFLAAAFSKSGREEEGAKLADKAFEMKVDLPEQRADDAKALADIGFVDWAVREYEQAVEDLPVVSVDSLRARQEWAVWLHDRELYKQASDVLGDFFKAMSEDRAAQRKLLEQVEGRFFLNSISARHQYYLACYYDTRKEYDREREALLKAWRSYKEDPDILISMYRLKEADEEFRTETRRWIQEMSQRHLKYINDNPEVAYLYNQRAWLIANTEGDYAQAVEHSLRSLELEPGEASYLDTLGRCYFAAGDLENAVKSQRRAVELAPHYQIMRRQLKQFEDALAAKKK